MEYSVKTSISIFIDSDTENNWLNLHLQDTISYLYAKSYNNFISLSFVFLKINIIYCKLSWEKTQFEVH